MVRDTGPRRERGFTIYDLVFEVLELEVTMDQLDKASARLVSPPKRVVAFRGRMVAFGMRPNLILVELLAPA